MILRDQQRFFWSDQGTLRLWCQPVYYVTWAIAFALWVPGLAEAVYKPNKLVVTISDTPDPAPSQGEVKYKIGVKNDGRDRSFEVRVESPLPEGTEFVRCTLSIDAGPEACHQEAGGIVVATLGTMRAHKTVNVLLTLRMPAGNTTVTLTAKATGKQAFKGDDAESTTVVAGVAAAVLLPSGRTLSVSCGDTLDSSFFGSDTKLQLTENLSCTGRPFGLRISASGVTLSLNRKKIVSSEGKGSVGILISAGATNVTIDGGGTKGSSGIEYFDWCIKDEGGNEGLVVTQLRCFRARSAALDLVSNAVAIEESLIDNTIAKKNLTAELPGGVGIRVRGDNSHITNTFVRRSGKIGIWASGVATIEGNVRTMKVEKNSGVGIFLENGPHLVKGVVISADGPNQGTSTYGVVVAENGVGNVIEEIAVQEYGGSGIVVNGNETRIERSSVTQVGLDGFVSTGIHTTLNGNKVKRVSGVGFLIEGPDNILTSNTAERGGESGFLVTGARALLSNNDAIRNATHGYVLAGNDGVVDTSDTSRNAGDGFRATGNNNNIQGCSSEQNQGVGITVSGSANRFNNTQANGNSSYEWVIGGSNIDGDGNTANGRRISFPSEGGVIE